ncbi:MAG TPA: MFS transporter [Gemmatimonadaceae bacterium]|nr:MFS transporter [Gemmatimonadaceae bacterium]
MNGTNLRDSRPAAAPLQPPTPRSAAPVSPIGRYRWRIVALLFFATTLNYLDRQVIGILAPDLQRMFAWSDTDYAKIVAAFKIAYAIGLVSMGGILDRIGTRVGYAAGLTLWSLAGMAHAAVGTVFGFSAARFALGIAEAANFPAAVKTVAEWFPKKERALATGIFNSGANIGAIVAPLVVPIIAVRYGWQWAFILTGGIGFVWLAFWLTSYRRPEVHPRLSGSELAYIQADGVEPTTKIPYLRLLPHRETLTVCLLKFVTDPVWWFFLFWLPKFLNERYGLSLLELGPPLVVIYLASDVGSIAGGWLSSSFVKRGHSIDFARKAAILICGLFAVPIFLVTQTDSLWVAVALISLGTAAHQGCSANIYTVMADVFPRRAVASVVGLAGLAGAVSGALVDGFVGIMLDRTGSYVPVFALFSCAYVLAWLVLRVGIPKIRPIEL